MNWLSILRHKLPPTRVLIGAAFAFVSYCVTNIWKADIDDDIRKYTALTARAAEIETQLRTLSMFQAIEASLSETIWQIQQISSKNPDVKAGATAHENPMTLNQPAARARPPYSVEEQVAAARVMFLVVEFFGSLPADVQSLPYHAEFKGFQEAKDYFDVHLGYDPSAIRDCLEKIGVDGDGPSTEYGKKLAAVYMAAVQKIGEQAGDPSTIGSIARTPIELLNLTRQMQEAFIGLPPPPQHAVQTRACMYQGDKYTHGMLIQLSQVFRRTVAGELIQPRTATKRQIERLEIALYGISGLIALFGSKPGEPSGPPQGPARRSAAEIERLRRMNPKPIRHPR